MPNNNGVGGSQDDYKPSIGGQLMQGAVDTLTGGLGGIIGAGIGLASQGWQDQRQLRQNEKLLAQQRASDYQMMKLQQGLAMKYWEDTNYSAQIKQMEKAGLSPGLIYGKGGSGGQLMQPNASSKAGQAVGSGELMAGISVMNALEQAKLVREQKRKTAEEVERLRLENKDLREEMGFDPTRISGQKTEVVGDNVISVTKILANNKERMRRLQAEQQRYINAGLLDDNKVKALGGRLAELGMTIHDELLQRQIVLWMQANGYELKDLTKDNIGSFLKSLIE